MSIETHKKHDFHEKTHALNVKRLEYETNRLLFSGLLVAIAIHAVLFSFLTFEQTTPHVSRPIPVELIIRPPRMTRPFIIPRSDPARRELRRQMIERIPTDILQLKTTPSPEEIITFIDEFDMILSSEDILDIVSDVIYDMDMQMRRTALDSLHREAFPMEIAEYLDTIEREAAEMFSMRESLLTIDDLDIGQYRGLVIKDPEDKQNVQGFVHIPSSIWGVDLGQSRGNDTLYPPDTGKQAVMGLVEGFGIYTGISMTLDRQMYLDQPGLLEYPIVYISAERGFDLTGQERNNLREYIAKGGFAMLEAYSVPAFNALSQMVRDALEIRVQILPIPEDHPIMHMYYDFENPTVRINGEDMLIPEAMFSLNGVFWHDELVAVLLTGEYGSAWAARNFENPYFRLAVNAVVYSLIKEDSLAKQYINAD